MKKGTSPILIKFGKREHLEQLKNGIVHFSSLKAFQEDPTAFRGDSMEGRLLLDPSKPFLINGKDTKTGKPSKIKAFRLRTGSFDNDLITVA